LGKSNTWDKQQQEADVIM